MGFSELEKWVLSRVDHAGGEQGLWFPRVHYVALNLSERWEEGDVQETLRSLISSGAVSLVPHLPTCAGDNNFSGTLPEGPAEQQRLHLAPRVLRQVRAARRRGQVPARGHFELTALGKNLEVAALRAHVPLAFDREWLGHGRAAISLRLGDGGVLLIHEQEKIARRFLIDQRESLQLLRKYPGVEICRLRLQYNLEMGPGWLGELLMPSFPLMRLANELDLELDYYLARAGRKHQPKEFSREKFLEGW
jgi:hypothetical protein